MDKLKKEASEEFEKRFVISSINYRGFGMIDPDDVWQFIDQLIDKTYKEGYKNGWHIGYQQGHEDV